MRFLKIHVNKISPPLFYIGIYFFTAPTFSQARTCNNLLMTTTLPHLIFVSPNDTSKNSTSRIYSITLEAVLGNIIKKTAIH